MQRSPPAGLDLICHRRGTRRGPPDALRAACRESRRQLYAVAAERAPYPGNVLSRTRRRILLAFVADALLVIVFCAIGRASHEESPVWGLLTTAWPFLLALVAGWCVARAWRWPLAPLRTGLPIWAVTVMAAMLLRLLAGQGTAPAFIVVAALTLGTLLVGWRGISAAVLRGRGRASTAVADENMKS